MCAPKPGGKLRQYRIALVVGTRPEAIKLSPVAHALAALGEPPHLFVTGQHPGSSWATIGLDGFAAIPLDCPGQPDPMLHAELVRAALRRLLPLDPPDLLVVQGDTSSALGGALAASEAGHSLAHVEAGLRTYDPNHAVAGGREPRHHRPAGRPAVRADRGQCRQPAPRQALPAQVHVTGNSGIDALAGAGRAAAAQAAATMVARAAFTLLVTCHRRENWGAGLDQLGEALIVELARAKVSSDVVLPPNPNGHRTADAAARRASTASAWSLRFPMPR